MKSEQYLFNLLKIAEGFDCKVPVEVGRGMVGWVSEARKFCGASGGDVVQKNFLTSFQDLCLSVSRLASQEF